MKGKTKTMSIVLCLAAALPRLVSAELTEISNYRAYSENFASAGQPTAEQLQDIRDAGFERVIYIAFSTDGRALSNEDKIVRDLGMEYIQIPVVWTAPTLEDFNSFASLMRQDPSKKTLLHCQVNARASAFSFLYRVIHEDVPIAEAKADMNSVWEPNETWRQFIFDVLDQNGLSPDCPDCRWEAAEP